MKYRIQDSTKIKGFHEQLSATTYMRLTTEKLIWFRKIADTIGSMKSRALAGFHAFTGCDTTGNCTGKGKMSWWKHFVKAHTNIIGVFVSVGASHEINSAVLDQLQMFTCNVCCPAMKCQMRIILFRHVHATSR